MSGRFRFWLAERAAPPVAELLIRALRRTIHLRAHGRETVEQFARQGQPYIHVFWHAHLLLMVYSYIGPEMVFLISRHRDGELIARTIERFGHKAARGSTTEGGAMALREMFRAVRRGADIGFTPDGPRGPARKVQPGCIVAARHLGIPVVPIAMGAAPAWRLQSWDNFVIPKPGADVLFAYGAPILVAPDATIDEASGRLERALLDLEQFAGRSAADRAVGKPI